MRGAVRGTLPTGTFAIEALRVNVTVEAIDKLCLHRPSALHFETPAGLAVRSVHLALGCWRRVQQIHCAPAFAQVAASRVVPSDKRVFRDPYLDL